jgi:hypothetical protein
MKSFLFTHHAKCDILPQFVNRTEESSDDEILGFLRFYRLTGLVPAGATIVEAIQ